MGKTVLQRIGRQRRYRGRCSDGVVLEPRRERPLKFVSQMAERHGLVKIFASLCAFLGVARVWTPIGSCYYYRSYLGYVARVKCAGFCHCVLRNLSVCWFICRFPSTSTKQQDRFFTHVCEECVKIITSSHMGYSATKSAKLLNSTSTPPKAVWR